MKTIAMNSQVSKSKGIIAAHAVLERNRLRSAVVRDKRVFSRGLQEIAKRHGLGYNEVVDLLEEQSAADVQQARERGFRDGQIAARLGPLATSRYVM